jgi:DNA modification methylase
MIDKKATTLNGICPYFTMFPLDFPYTILSERAQVGEWVLDPFCGRGTTNYASRLLGLPSIGIDSSPVAVALSEAKLANTSPKLIIQMARRILAEIQEPQSIPTGEFWDWAFDKQVLHTLCCLREGLLQNCRSDTRKALRALIMGALHGPQPKSHFSYFSNQCQRTYAPKPRYAVKFWQTRNLTPPVVDVLALIEIRANRYYAQEYKPAIGKIFQNDSRNQQVYTHLQPHCQVNWIITSPPYYGLRTYIPDQWLRWWFIGGPSTVDYSTQGQISHLSPDTFASQLGSVWQNTRLICAPNAQLIIRFGAIHNRKVDALALLKSSLQNSAWAIRTVESAGSAARGKRQALHFSHSQQNAIEEYDIWCQLT